MPCSSTSSRSFRNWGNEHAETAMPPPRDKTAGVFVPFQLITDAGKLSFLSTTTVFGTPIDVTLSECFFPADDATAQALQR
jgi:hypothetical protein